MIKNILQLFLIGYAGILVAQTSERPWGADLNLNFREYDGDFGSQFFKFEDNNAQVGLGISRYMNSWLDLRAFGNYGKSDYQGTNAVPASISNRLQLTAFNLGLQGQFKLNNGWILKEDALIGPYLGLGVAYWNSKNESMVNPSTESSISIPMSAGIKFNIHPRVNLFAQTAYNAVFSDKIDGYEQAGNDNLMQYSVGVSFNFGKGKSSSSIKDEDKDGVADDIDRCPGTKRGAKVDKFGCEILSLEANDMIKGIINNILFETNSANLKGSSKTELDKLVVVLNKYTNGILIIEGHTDNTGDADYNLTLSTKRAQSVKSYLISKGISEDRLIAKGYGQTLPVASNDTEAGRKQNRRVELILTK